MAPLGKGEIAHPATEAEVSHILCDAQRRGLKVSPRGGGTKAFWEQSAEPVDLVVTTRQLSRVLEHAAGDLTVTVEAGCTIATLQAILSRHKQRLAFDPLWPDGATVGGVIATNDSGSLRAGFGSLRDLILGVTVALADGTLAASGGKVVKNVAGYDLPKLMVGAFGTLGVVTRATFRLHPLPNATRTIRFAARAPADAQRFVLAMHESGPPVTGLQVVGGSSEPWRLAARLEGSPAGVHATAPALCELAARCNLAQTAEPPDPWSERERIWSEEGAVAKLTFPPSQLAALCDAVVAPAWKLVAQGVGVAMLSVTGAYTDGGPERMERLAQNIRAMGGSLVVLRGTADLKRRVDALYHIDAIALMRRIKQQFDPTRVLNPDRLGGGI